MANELTATAGGSATVTVLGAWELRAGSHDTTEWLDGAADVAYPGGGPSGDIVFRVVRAPQPAGAGGSAREPAVGRQPACGG